MKSIDCATLKKLLENDEAILVDVREIIENKSERIKGSHLIPSGKISVDKLPQTKGKKLVVHCKSGGRSSNACSKLLKQDPQLEIYNLEGGISAWKNCGFEIESSSTKCLPIERQVQLVAGLSIATGVLLGLFISTWFFLIPLFFGCGLAFAGITGWCGLGILLAKLPCNQKAEKNFCSISKN